jgi:DNA repair ATPase RecN
MATDLFNLSEAEQQFFNTGEMSEELAAAHGESAPTPPVEAAPDPAPKIEEPIVNPQNDALELLRKSLQEEQRLRADLEARLNAQTEAAKPKIEIPDPDTDPLGAMMHQLNSVNKTVQDLQAKLTEQRQQQEQQQQLTEFQASMRNLRDEYIKTTPDFQAAYDHLRSARTEDMKALGIPDAQIQQALLRDELIVAQNAIQQGKNPAEIMYQMSKRHGFNPSSVKQPVQQSTTKLDILQRGQQSSKQLAATPPSNDDITLDTLKNASEADLNKLVLDDKSWNKISGNSSLNDLFH